MNTPPTTSEHHEREPDDDFLLDWFALDLEDDEPDFRPAAALPQEAADEPLPPPPDLPLHLAAPLRTWRRGLGEIGAGFAIVVSCEWLFGSGIGSYGCEPHPYWLVVLPLAAARGLVLGLVAAALGTALFFVGTAQAEVLSHWSDLFAFRHAMTPLGFFLAAFAVGQVRDVLVDRYADLWRHTLHVASDRAQAVARVERLGETNRELKVRLLDHGAQFGHLLEAARRLESATAKNLFEVALDMVVEHCGGERCSVVDVRGDQLRIAAIRGWSADDLDGLVARASGCEALRAAALSGHRFNVFSLQDAAVTDGPMLVAPLCAEDGRVEALLCLDRMTPDRFTEGSASVFFDIGEWAQLGMQRLANGRHPADFTPDGHALLKSYTWVGNTEDLPARLRVEDGRFAETGMTTCLIPIHALGGTEDGVDQHKLDQLLESTVLSGVLRGADSLYRLPEPGAWVLVLPATPKTAATLVQRRLEHLLSLLRFGRVQGFRTDVVAPQTRRGTLVGLVPSLVAWARETERSTIPRGELPGATPASAYAILDAMEFARRVQVEGSLGRRFATDLHVIELDFESVPVARPEAALPVLTRFAERFLPKTATVHTIGEHRFAMVLPYVSCSAAFRIGHEFSRSVATNLGLPTNQGVQFGVFALGGAPGEADELLCDLFRIAGHRIHDEAQHAAVDLASAEEVGS